MLNGNQGRACRMLKVFSKIPGVCVSTIGACTTRDTACYVASLSCSLLSMATKWCAEGHRIEDARNMWKAFRGYRPSVTEVWLIAFILAVNACCSACGADMHQWSIWWNIKKSSPMRGLLYCGLMKCKVPRKTAAIMNNRTSN